MAGADLMELSPIYDPTGMSACLASGTAFEQFCLLAEATARRTGKTNKTHWKPVYMNSVFNRLAVSL